MVQRKPRLHNYLFWAIFSPSTDFSRNRPKETNLTPSQCALFCTLNLNDGNRAWQCFTYMHDI